MDCLKTELPQIQPDKGHSSLPSLPVHSEQSQMTPVRHAFLLPQQSALQKNKGEEREYQISEEVWTGRSR
ncbi:hypothetical protein VTN00DRAFT_4474 [Thermoascus crustaceus]|uniref:uncharacterized protein n=1 Tax=Thermoascus crustaceus TaxID=5088 RepID=UPI00374290FD